MEIIAFIILLLCVIKLNNDVINLKKEVVRLRRKINIAIPGRICDLEDEIKLLKEKG